MAAACVTTFTSAISRTHTYARSNILSMEATAARSISPMRAVIQQGGDCGGRNGLWSHHPIGNRRAPAWRSIGADRRRRPRVCAPRLETDTFRTGDANCRRLEMDEVAKLN